jgi:hypothetical protein
MTHIYATGCPGSLDFNFAQNPEAIPKAAVVYAVCDANQCVDHLDERTCRAMTDGEFYELQALIRQACQVEAELLRVRRAANPFRRLCAWLKRHIAKLVVNVRGLAVQASLSREKNA